MKVVLTIAGLDPSGGAGIVADIKTISAFGCFPAAALTSITYQNTTGVFGADMKVVRNDETTVDEIENDLRPEKILISPGPGTPAGGPPTPSGRQARTRRTCWGCPASAGSRPGGRRIWWCSHRILVWLR